MDSTTIIGTIKLLVDSDKDADKITTEAKSILSSYVSDITVEVSQEESSDRAYISDAVVLDS